MQTSLYEDVRVLKGSNGHYLASRAPHTGLVDVRLVCGEQLADDVWTTFDPLIEPWYSTALLHIAAFESTVEVIDYIIGETREQIWRHHKELCEALQMNLLALEWTDRGKVVLVAVRPKERV